MTDRVTIAYIDHAMGIAGAEAETGMDVWINDTKYRRISNYDVNDRDDREDVGSCSYRYFKWERIKWKVLKNDGKTLFMVADEAIDCKDYNEEYINITWENSTIRSWLNNSFYDTAFSSREQEAIVTQNVINEDNSFYGTEGGNDTRDKIYLLSIDEVTNEEYGFCSDYNTSSMSRRVKMNDYVAARDILGIFRNIDEYGDNCWWWLRSPGYDSSTATRIDYEGEVDCYGIYVHEYATEVCPALHVRLSSDTWFVEDDETSGEGGGAPKATEPNASILTESHVEKDTKLSLSCATEGASIYYTTNGITPTTGTIPYREEIIIDKDMTVKAIAVCRGYRASDVAEFSYKIKESVDEENSWLFQFYPVLFLLVLLLFGLLIKSRKKINI